MILIGKSRSVGGILRAHWPIDEGIFESVFEIITLWRAKVRLHDFFNFRTFIFKMSTRAKKIGILVKKTTYRYYFFQIIQLPSCRQRFG